MIYYLISKLLLVYIVTECTFDFDCFYYWCIFQSDILDEEEEEEEEDEMDELTLSFNDVEVVIL